MARFDVNVASKPFITTRPWLIALGLASLVGAALTFHNVYNLTRALNRRGGVAASVAAQRAEIIALKAERDQAAKALGQTERQRVQDRATFAAALVKGRTLSWTALFNDIERVIPRDVRIISINPNLSGPKLELAFDCRAKTNPAKLEFFQRLYEPPFDDPYLLGETISNDEIRFDIRCSYTPTLGAVAEAGPGADALTDSVPGAGGVRELTP